MLSSCSPPSLDRCKSVSPCLAKIRPRSPALDAGTSFASIISIISQLLSFHLVICWSRSVYRVRKGLGRFTPLVRNSKYCWVQTVLVPLVSLGRYIVAITSFFFLLCSMM